MQPASASALLAQADITNTMQPHSAQNMILPANKKIKKYSTQMPLAKQMTAPTTQPHFQISKPFNVVSLLQTNSTNVQQQQPHAQPAHHQLQQSYANVLNRPTTHQSTLICNAGGSIMTVNSCQLNAAELSSTTAAIYNISGHPRPLTATVGVGVDANGRIVSSSDICNGGGSTSNAIGGAGNTINGSPAGGSSCSGNNTNTSNLLALGNTHGITLGTSSGQAAGYIHEKNLIGFSCVDNRKYDYKNNNLLANSSFQGAQEYVSTSNNSSAAARNNAQAGGIYRATPPTSNAPRGGNAGTRHVHMPTMYTQQMHQNMVLPTYTQFAQRQPTFPTPHIQYAPAPIPTYYPYPTYLPTLQQQPAHPRSGVAVNTNVNVGNALQSGPNGPMTGPSTTTTPLQMLSGAVQPGANAVLGVSTNGGGQVNVSSMVGVGIPPNVAPQPEQQTSRRRHQYRLQIIDPTTKKNILDDLDKSTSHADVEYQEHLPQALIQTDVVAACISQSDQQNILTLDPAAMLMSTAADIKASVSNPTEQIPSQNLENITHTPVVSARSDAPSVEILPTSQKPKSKKILLSPTEDFIPVSTINVEAVAANPTFKTSSDALDDVLTQQSDSSITEQQQQQTEPVIQFHPATNVPQPQQTTCEISSVCVETLNSNKENLATTNAVVLSSTAEQNSSENLALGTTTTAKTTNPIDLQSSSSTVVNEPLDVIDDNTMHISESDDIQQESVGDEERVCRSAEISNAVQNKSDVELVEVEEITITPHEKSPDETDRAAITGTNIESLVTTTTTKDDNEFVSVDTEEIVNKNKLSSADQCIRQQELNSALINYNEGQWSPNNPTGKRQYDREQLLQLREAKASRIQPEVSNVSILPQPNLMPSFVRNNKRAHTIGMIGGQRGNESNNNNNSSIFVGKQASMSGVQGSSGRSSMKGIIHVNLSLNQDVKLNETENAWRPRLYAKSSDNATTESGQQSSQEKEELVRRVRGILNKLTPERFDYLVEEIIKLKIDTPEKMDEVIVLVFEKAIDEPNFSVSYARLCHRLITEVKARDERMESGTKSNLAHFRNALLDKTEREFTQNVSQSTAKEIKLQPLVDRIKKCNDPNEKAELEALLEEEERKIRRRSGGTVRFIGELFKISMLTGKIIYSCIDTLLNPHSEDMLECLCKLLTTVGAKFEQTSVNAKESSRCYSLEKSIAKMQAIASKTDKEGAKVSSRVRFMLQDVIDLRKNKWQSTRNEAPKTMGQIEKEAKNEQLSAQFMNYSGSLSTSGASGALQSGGSKRDERTGGGRYGSDNRSGYGGSHSQRGAGNESSSMRHQQISGSGLSAVGGSSSSHTNGGSSEENAWHIQTSKGSRSQAVDTNKLEGLSLQLNQNLDTKKMGGVSQFIWSNNSSSRQATTTPTSMPSNSFAALSSLIDKTNTDRDRERERSGPRSKGSYNKGSIERERYGERGMHSRTGSSQGSRESSSSRGGQQARGMLSSSSMQKTASHTKYTQQQPPSKVPGKNSVNSGSLYRGELQSNYNLVVNSNTKTTTTPPAVFDEPRDMNLQIIKSVVSEMIDLTLASKTVTPTVVACISRVPETQLCGFLYYILTDYLHLADVGKQYRLYLANTVAELIQQHHISVDHFRLAYKEFSELASDLIVDVPDLWTYVLQFVGPLIVKKLLTMPDLWNKQLKDNDDPSMGKKFLKAYLIYCTREVGPNFTRSMWKKFNLRWSDYLPEHEVKSFIEANNLEYVEDEKKLPVIEVRDSHEKHVKNVVEHIEYLLKEGSAVDYIIDYSNGNIVIPDKLFIRSLTHILGNFAIVYRDNSYKLEPDLFQKCCIPVLQRYIDSNEDLQLECLYAMQLLVHSLEHPRGLLGDLFGELYDGYVIQKETLCKWRDSKDQSAGKGVAVKSLNPFFNSIFNDENI